MTYEESAVVAALRAQARAELLVMEGTFAKFEESLTDELRTELQAHMEGLQRILGGRPTLARIERSFTERGAQVLRFPGKKKGFVSGRVGPGEKISNADCFRQMTDGFPGPNDNGMPKEGA